MLALAGLFGVMMAGLVADALLAGKADDPQDDDLPPDDDDEPLLSDGNLLDDLPGDPTIPTSDDIRDAPYAAVFARGTDQDDLMDGFGADDRIDGGDASGCATSGDGADDLVLQEWLKESSVTQIADYNPGVDKLVIVYDPVVHPDPELTVEANRDGLGHSVFLDGSKVAVVNGAAVRAKDIGLIAADKP